MAEPSPALRRPEWLVQFGRRLLLARGRAGLTQLALAAPDLSKSFISLLESARTYPSVETVISLARRVNSSVASLLLDHAELRRETAFNLLYLAANMDLAAHGAEALRMTAAAEALLPDMPADLRVRAALLRAHVAITLGRLDEGTRWSDEAATVSRRHRLGSTLGMALAFRGLVELRRGKHKEALPILEEAVAILQRTKASRTEENVRALLSLGAARFQLGQNNRALQAYRRALELTTRLRLQALRGRALMGLGLIEWSRRRLDLAAGFLGEAHDAFARAEDLTEMSRALGNLGLVRREQGRLNEALAVLEQALRVQDRLAAPRDRSATLDEMARVYLDLRRAGDAARSARRAIKDARAVGDRMREAAAQVTLGRVLRAQGRRREAIALLRGAVATFKRLGLESRAATASLELGGMLTDAGADKEAAGYLKQALTPRTATLASPPASAVGEPPTP